MNKLNAVIARHAVESSMEGEYTVNLNEFAEACYDQIDSDDLIQMLKLEEPTDFLPEDIADQTDCANWDITPDQWVTSLEQALTKKMIAN